MHLTKWQRWQERLCSLQREMEDDSDRLGFDLQKSSLLNNAIRQIEKASNSMEMLQALEPSESQEQPRLTVLSGGKDPNRDAPF